MLQRKLEKMSPMYCSVKVGKKVRRLKVEALELLRHFETLVVENVSCELL